MNCQQSGWKSDETGRNRMMFVQIVITVSVGRLFFYVGDKSHGGEFMAPCRSSIRFIRGDSWRNGGTFSRREQFRFASRELISTFSNESLAFRDEKKLTLYPFLIVAAYDKCNNTEIFFVSTFLVRISRFIVIICYWVFFDEKDFLELPWNSRFSIGIVGQVSYESAEFWTSILS